jgi:hypothetical protein
VTTSARLSSASAAPSSAGEWPLPAAVELSWADGGYPAACCGHLLTGQGSLTKSVTVREDGKDSVVVHRQR